MLPEYTVNMISAQWIFLSFILYLPFHALYLLQQSWKQNKDKTQNKQTKLGASLHFWAETVNEQTCTNSCLAERSNSWILQAKPKNLDKHNDVHVLSHSIVSDSFVTLWTIAHQAPLSMGFFKQEYCSGLAFLSPGSFQSKDQIHISWVSYIAGGLFTHWVIQYFDGWSEKQFYVIKLHK